VCLQGLPPAERADVLDELVHDAKADEASAICNVGEQEQLAYLLADGHLPTSPQ
jgi:hypothetical protein